MIRKSILIFIALSFFSVCFAGSIQDMHKAAIARKNAISEVACDDCSGTLKFAWHMENDSVTPDVTVHDNITDPCGCSDGDEVGAIEGTPTFNTTTPSDGTYSLLSGDNDHNFQFAISAYDIIDCRDVKITFDVWVVTLPTTGNKDLIYAADSSTNLVVIYLKSTGEIEAKHVANGTAVYITTGSAIDTETWITCEYQADLGVGDSNDHYLACENESAVEENEVFGTWGGDADGNGTMSIGDNFGSATDGSVKLDVIKIYTADRWD